MSRALVNTKNTANVLLKLLGETELTIRRFGRTFKDP